jgi:RNA polymerase sigma-70 factor (ECF subfamily)
MEHCVMAVADETFEEGDAGAGPADEVGGRAERFVPLFSAAHPRVYAFLLTLLGDADSAREVLQETSLVLWRKFGDYDPAAGDFTKWACGIAYRQTQRFRRQRGRNHVRFTDELVERLAAAGTANVDRLEERRAALQECLSALSEDQRKLVWRCYGQDATVKQAAAELSRSVHTLYKALKRVRLQLMNCIDQRTRTEGRA